MQEFFTPATRKADARAIIKNINPYIKKIGNLIEQHNYEASSFLSILATLLHAYEHSEGPHKYKKFITNELNSILYNNQMLDAKRIKVLLALLNDFLNSGDIRKDDALYALLIAYFYYFAPILAMFYDTKDKSFAILNEQVIKPALYCRQAKSQSRFCQMFKRLFSSNLEKGIEFYYSGYPRIFVGMGNAYSSWLENIHELGHCKLMEKYRKQLFEFLQSYAETNDKSSLHWAAIISLLYLANNPSDKKIAYRLLVNVNALSASRVNDLCLALPHVCFDSEYSGQLFFMFLQKHLDVNSSGYHMLIDLLVGLSQTEEEKDAMIDRLLGQLDNDKTVLSFAQRDEMLKALQNLAYSTGAKQKIVRALLTHECHCKHGSVINAIAKLSHEANITDFVLERFTGFFLSEYASIASSGFPNLILSLEQKNDLIKELIGYINDDSLELILKDVVKDKPRIMRFTDEHDFNFRDFALEALSYLTFNQQQAESVVKHLPAWLNLQRSSLSAVLRIITNIPANTGVRQKALMTIMSFSKNADFSVKKNVITAICNNMAISEEDAGVLKPEFTRLCEDELSDMRVFIAKKMSQIECVYLKSFVIDRLVALMNDENIIVRINALMHLPQTQCEPNRELENKMKEIYSEIMACKSEPEIKKFLYWNKIQYARFVNYLEALPFGKDCIYTQTAQPVGASFGSKALASEEQQAATQIKYMLN